MKKLTLLIVLCLVTHGFLFAKGFGMGYLFEGGGSDYSSSSSYYSQHYGTSIQNGFLRFHSHSGHSATQFMLGYRRDKIQFENYVPFMSADGTGVLAYNANATIDRDALRVTLLKQLQLGRPSKFVLACNAGLFYENTLSASRYSSYDELNYSLGQGMLDNNLGFIVGGEIRFHWFTMGLKFEKLFFDPIDHEYILSQPLSTNNSSELRGLKLNPLMTFFYMGFNIDVFSKDTE